MKRPVKRRDAAETSLLYGDRVAKSDLRCEAYGTVDEGISALGLARQFCRPEVVDVIVHVQKQLFIVGAELATPAEYYEKLLNEHSVVTQEMVTGLENLIDDFESRITMPKHFIIPGSGSTGSASLDLARTIIRRAERRVVSLQQMNIAPNKELVNYLNRLSTLLFALARYQEAREK